MEAISSASRLGGRDRGFSDTFAARPRGFNERDPMRHGSSPAKQENRSPSNVPKGLETMLKTTTETGDIGMFSIKPSRVPNPSYTPRRMGIGTGLNELGAQKTKEAFQPYGAPMVDDRRRLPSYARDTSSDVLSMYDTASQKSGSRNFDDPDYRSYSMTQTYSSYTLSNHRSYASLRSQPDGQGFVQRPRSPFAYPTRLKRPGFRPSSPALTDGGAVDYSRRVEIGRVPYGPGQNTSSPSSLYAQKRKPPLSLRHEANRSTPSLLSQSSPPRRSSSPFVPRQYVHSSNDMQRRNATASGNTSPARSTLSRTSTGNLYATLSTSSTVTTPGKFHPPSPLYYDYTEDFEVEVSPQQEPLGAPPHFFIDKTIPEDRPMSADGPATRELHNTFKQTMALYDGSRFQAATPTSPERPEAIKARNFRVDNTDLSGHDQADSSPDSGETAEGVIDKVSDAKDDKEVIRLSGLGYGAWELSCHVEEAFGLPLSQSFVIDVGKNKEEKQQSDKKTVASGAEEQLDLDREPQSTRTSSYSLGSQFPQFPEPPSNENKTSIDAPKDSRGGQLHDKNETHAASHDSRRSGESLRGSSEKDQSLRRTSRESQCLPPSGRPRARSSGFSSINTGLTELVELISKTNNQVGKRNSVLSHPGRTPMTSPTIPDKSSLRAAHRQESQKPLVSSFNQQRGKELQMLAQRQPPKRNNHRMRRVEPPQDPKDVPNFSHQIAQKVIARSESPMLAPKPISPARQLKLKNSIPQLMKALPPIPPEPSLVPTSLDRAVTKTQELPSLEATSVSNSQAYSSADRADGSHFLNANLHALRELHDEVSLEPEVAVNETTKNSINHSITKTHQVPKLKLKTKSTTALRSFSPLSSQPWTLEENQPWSSQDSNSRLPPIPHSQKFTVSKQPKFRLKVIRGSDSTQGTVRVTRDSEKAELMSGIYLQNPKDLFTPNPAIDNLFQNFGKRLHSRKTSANSNYHSEESEPIFTGSNTPSPVNGAQEGNRILARGPVSGAGGLFESHSVFSDDSSQVAGQHSLRKRISNLRARIVVPYTSKVGAQSYDDITWKDRNGPQILPQPINQSDSNLPSNKRSFHVKPMRRFTEKLHRQRLRAKVRSWLRGARSAIARARSRHARAGSGSGADGDKLE